MIESTSAIVDTAQPSLLALDVRQFVSFEILDQRYCVDVLAVREIRMLEVITPVPGANAPVRGVMNLRGSIVPVCDLRMRFGLGATPISSVNASIIVSVADRIFALMVDQVLDIISVPAAQISALPETGSQDQNPFFGSIVSCDDQVLIEIDLDRMTDLSFAIGSTSD